MARSRSSRARLGRKTFDSAADAARTFYDGNELFFDHVRDPIDGLRAWADGIDIRTGKRTSQKLVHSAAGRKIFDAGLGAPQIKAALQWVFQQAPGRRWDAVDWDAINDLGESLAPYYEAPAREPGTPGLYWRPMIGAGRPLAERMDELDPGDALELGELESREGLALAVADLRETYEGTRECLSPRLRSTVEHRIAEWSRWVSDPTEIPEYACEPDEATQGYVCNYPLVLGELRELRGACRHAYDPDWFVDESDAELPGFPPAPFGDPRGRGPAPEEDAAPAGPRDVPGLPPVPAELGAPPELRMRRADGDAFGAPARDVDDTRQIGAVFYQSEFRRRSGKQHGPYWYAYWRGEDGRRRSKYIGREFAEVRPD